MFFEVHRNELLISPRVRLWWLMTALVDELTNCTHIPCAVETSRQQSVLTRDGERPHYMYNILGSYNCYSLLQNEAKTRNDC